MYDYDDLEQALRIAENSAGAFRAFSILLAIAFIASLILTIMVYSTYVGKSPEKRFSLWDSSTWSSFLNFDVLIIEGIIKWLYLFLAVFTALSGIAAIIATIFLGDIGAFFATLFAMLLIVPIAEVLHRIAYEYSMLLIVIARNTTDMVSGRGGDRPARGTAAPVRPMPKEPATCPKCGLPVSPGARFCGHCGHSF